MLVDGWILRDDRRVTAPDPLSLSKTRRQGAEALLRRSGATIGAKGTVVKIKHCVTIAPGTILPPALAHGERRRRRVIEHTRLKRVGAPKDLARTVIFLTEMEPATGALLFVDGEWALR
jgi:NAD(P)-dependent dehydrogenase (short-subunit alcohol dehydrogenase family)